MAYGVITTPVTGTTISTTAFGIKVKDNFDAAFPLGVDGWTSFTPTLTQSVTVTKTVTYAKYQRVGRTIFASYDLAITGAGTTANAILLGLPVAAATTGCATGSFRYFDTGNTIYAGSVVSNTTTTLQFFVSGNGNPMGVNPTFAAANGDSMQVHVTYEAAT